MVNDALMQFEIGLQVRGFQFFTGLICFRFICYPVPASCSVSRKLFESHQFWNFDIVTINVPWDINKHWIIPKADQPIFFFNLDYLPNEVEKTNSEFRLNQRREFRVGYGPCFLMRGLLVVGISFISFLYD